MTQQLDERSIVTGAVPEWVARARRGRMAIGDALVQGSRVLLAAGPIDVPSADELTAAIVRMSRLDPQRRLLRRIDDRGRWIVPADDDIETAAAEVVVEADLSGDMDDVLARVAARFEPGTSYRVLVGSDRIIVMFDHATSDALVNSNVIGALVAVARGDDVPSLFRGGDAAFPLVRAALATFSSPSRVKALLRGRGAPLEEQAREQAEDGELVAPVSAGPAPRLECVSVVIGREQFRAIRAWGRKRGASFVATEAVLYHRALTRAGVPLAAGVEIPVDLRRYLKEGSGAKGNFIAGQRCSAIGGVERIDAELEAVLASGRPLAIAAYGALLASIARLRPGARPRVAASALRPARPALLVSSIGHTRRYDSLPWTAPLGSRRAPLCMDVLGPEWISCGSLLIGGEAHVTASFDARFHDRAAVAAAMRLLAGDCVAILDGERD